MKVLADETIQELKKRFRPEAARDLTATYLINIRGEGGAAYLTKINQGTCEFIEQDQNKPGPADCSITIAAEDLAQIFAGKMSAMTAALSGLPAVDGEIGLAMKLVPVFFEG